MGVKVKLNGKFKPYSNEDKPPVGFPKVGKNKYGIKKALKPVVKKKKVSHYSVT